MEEKFNKETKEMLSLLVFLSGICASSLALSETDNAITVFKMLALKREMKVLGHDDAGNQWQALPESLRKA